MAGTTHLRRSLGLPLVTLYGLGNILGAGIYVLIGKVAGTAGSSAALAFMIAMAVAGLTAFSYMELSSRYPVSASVSVYLHKAFGKRWLSIAIGLAMVVSGIASAAALAQGFAGYLSSIVSVPAVVASLGLLVGVGLLAAKGIGESAAVAAVFTAVEILGLGLIVWAGRAVFAEVDAGALLTIDPAVGWGGVMAGAFLAFYAFIGFEDMVNVSEEVKRPRRTMPLAILLSLIAATVLYMLVVVVAITLLPSGDLANSSAPLADVYSAAGANNATMISAIGIAAAVNGVVVQVIMGSRILYGLAAQGWIYQGFARLGRSQTPLLATVVVVGLMVVGTVLLPLVSLAKLTSLLVLSIFAMVNIALIKVKNQQTKPGYRHLSVPRAIPVLGALSCAGLIVYQIVA